MTTTEVVNVPVVKFATMEDFVMELAGDFNPNTDVWEQVELVNPDFSFFMDVHIEPLFDTLTESGLNEDQIADFSLAMYGPVLDFYQIGSDNDVLYVMAVGQR